MKKLLFLAALVALWYYNPTEAQFRQFAKGQTEKFIDQEAAKNDASENPLVAMIRGFASSELGKIAERNVKRDNYFLASTYTLDLPPEISNKDWKFLGIAGQFIPLERPEFLEKSK